MSTDTVEIVGCVRLQRWQKLPWVAVFMKISFGEMVTDRLKVWRCDSARRSFQVKSTVVLCTGRWGNRMGDMWSWWWLLVLLLHPSLYLSLSTEPEQIPEYADDRQEGRSGLALIFKKGDLFASPPSRTGERRTRRHKMTESISSVRLRPNKFRIPFHTSLLFTILFCDSPSYSTQWMLSYAKMGTSPQQ